MSKIFQQTDEQLGQKTIRLNEDVWFEIQQPMLLRMANTDAGKDLLCIPKDYKNIFKIGKNYIFHNPRMEKGKFSYDTKFVKDWDFRVGAKWANVIRYRWKEFQEMAVYFQDAIPFKPVTLVGVRARYAFGGPYYPDPGTPGTTTVDRGFDPAASVDWATARGLTTAAMATEDGTSLNIQSAKFGASDFRVRWAHTGFDTSAIPDTDSISAAAMSGYATTVVGGADATTIDIVSSSPASNTTIVGGDFDGRGFTSYGSLAESSWVASQYNVINLNATGIAAINKTGVTNFGWTQGLDVSNTEPTVNNGVVISSADVADVTQDPKLTGTSSVPTAVSDVISRGILPFAR